jgi:hypothetical protein
MRVARLFVVALSFVLVLSLASSASAAAPANPFTGAGFDVSYPQCPGSAMSGSFAIIGVTGGRAFTQNQCFGAEYDGALVSQKSIYMNLNAAIGSTASNGLTGPYTASGVCGHGDKTCQAYNYGWKAAQYAYGLAGSRTASTWWLDIETANSWQAQVSLNQATIQGAVDFLLNRKSTQTVGITNVGIYSWDSAWQKITGGWKAGLPVWYAGVGSPSCATSSFTGGQVWLVQQTSGAPNGDIAC